MINLCRLMLKVDLGHASFPEARVVNLIDDLKAMFGCEEPAIQEADMATLKETFRSYLKMKSTDPSTIRNKVYRLNCLIRLAEEQGLLPKREGIPLPPRPKRDGPGRRRYNGLCAFDDWCRLRSISVCEITSETFTSYRDYLRSKPGTWSEDRYNCAVHGWHTLAVERVVHELDLPRWNDHSRDDYGLPREKWPGGVTAEFDMFCRAASGRATCGEKRRSLLRGESLDDIQRELCRFLGYLVNADGQDISNSSLVQLIGDREKVIGFISWHIAERCGGTERKYHRETLHWFARLLEWFGDNQAVAPEYRVVARSIKAVRARDPFPERPITFEQFSAAALRALRKAEEEWNALVPCNCRTETELSAAIAYRDALLFAFLVCRPMRSRNMREMEVGPNLYKGGGEWRLRFSEEEMKAAEYNCAFPKVLVPYLEFYLNEVRPTLCRRGGGTELFLTKSGKRMGRSGFWKIMTKSGQRIMDLKTNPHLFRYLIPSAYLLRYPGRALEMQALLGHSVLETTLRYYVHVYSRVASQRAAEVLRQNCPAMVELGTLFIPSIES